MSGGPVVQMAVNQWLPVIELSTKTHLKAPDWPDGNLGPSGLQLPYCGTKWIWDPAGVHQLTVKTEDRLLHWQKVKRRWRQHMRRQPFISIYSSCAHVNSFLSAA